MNEYGALVKWPWQREKDSEEILSLCQNVDTKIQIDCSGSNLGLRGVYVTSRVLGHKVWQTNFYPIQLNFTLIIVNWITKANVYFV